MTSAPYDQKNAEDAEANTRLLSEAIKRIERDPSLPASISALSKMVGMHRNSISRRIWPAEKLQAIKEKRDQQEKEQALNQKISLSPEQLLEQSRLEVIYWFNELLDARASVAALTKTNGETESSRSFYVNQSRDRLDIINKLRSDNMKLQDAVAVLEEELSAYRANASGP